MYGGIWVYKDIFDNPYYQLSLNSISPLDDKFDELFFDEIFKSTAKDISLKALLATGQRIPGVGNGVLQDILFNAGLHPKRKKSTLSDFHKAGIFQLKYSYHGRYSEPGRCQTYASLPILVKHIDIRYNIIVKYFYDNSKLSLQ
jgi:formamidopyrimidine-DNA glycosylase